MDVLNDKDTWPRRQTIENKVLEQSAQIFGSNAARQFIGGRCSLKPNVKHICQQRNETDLFGARCKPRLDTLVGLASLQELNVQQPPYNTTKCKVWRVVLDVIGEPIKHSDAHLFAVFDEGIGKRGFPNARFSDDDGNLRF